MHSMTAFARCELETARGVLSWELRTLNHRYLDLNLRLPEEFRVLEAPVRERIAARVRRGKLEAVLRLQSDTAGSSEATVNEALVDKLLEMLGSVEQRMENPARVAPIDILKWPNVLQPAAIDSDRLRTEALSLLDDALDEIEDTRAREGAMIRDLILRRCAEIGDQLKIVGDRMPEVLEHFRNKLKAKLEELEGGFDDGRLEQELLYLTQKSDIQEELDRIKVHLEEVERVLDQQGPGGRRLDFLMQELNREANTIGSKSIDAPVTRASVEIKVAIEQIREQVQNLE